MLLQQKTARSRGVRKEVSNPALTVSRQSELRSPVESLLRDLALVLHSTETVRQAMQADQAICSAAS